MITETEVCVGCGQPTHQYEYVGIGESPTAPANANGFRAEAFPICRTCHHQPPRPMKFHYAPRAEVGKYLARAGSNFLGGD
jgi:hypothetical protein